MADEEFCDDNATNQNPFIETNNVECDPSQVQSARPFDPNNVDDLTSQPTDRKGNYILPDGSVITPGQVQLRDWANQGRDSGLDRNNLNNLLGLLGLFGCGGISLPSFSLPTIDLPDLDFELPDIDFDLDFDLGLPNLCDLVGNGTGIIGLVQQAMGLIAANTGGCKPPVIKNVSKAEHISDEEQENAGKTEDTESFEDKNEGSSASIFDIVDIAQDAVNQALGFVQAVIGSVLGAINSVTGQISSAISSVTSQLAPLAAGVAALDATFGGASGTGGVTTGFTTLGVSLGGISASVDTYGSSSQEKLAAAPSSVYSNTAAAAAYENNLRQEQQVMTQVQQKLVEMERVIANMIKEMSENLIESGISPNSPLYKSLMKNFEASLRNANRTAEKLNDQVIQSDKRMNTATDVFLSASI